MLGIEICSNQRAEDIGGWPFKRREDHVSSLKKLILTYVNNNKNNIMAISVGKNIQ